MQAIIEQYKKELLQVAQYSVETVTNYIYCIYEYIDYAKKQLNINPLKAKAKHIWLWMAALKQKGISPSRLIHHRSALKGLFELLIKMNKIDQNPVDAILPIRKRQSDLNQPIATEVAYKLLRSIDQSSWLGERNFLIISILWALGLRLDELRNLKVGDFETNHDPQNNIGLLRVHGKDKKQRALFVVDKLYTNLQKYLNHPQSPSEKLQPLFPSKYSKAKAISTDRVQRMIHEYAQKAGIEERITPHVLRHSFATEMYHQNVPVEDIQTMLGHDDIADTAIYIHVSDELKEQALEHITINFNRNFPELSVVT